MLARPERLQHQRAVRPALGEDRHRVEAAVEHGLKAGIGPRQAEPLTEGLGPFRQDVGDMDF